MVKSKKGFFAGARIQKILVAAGARRVAADAVAALNEAVTERGRVISERAVEIAKNSGRKTVKDQDIALAAR